MPAAVPGPPQRNEQMWQALKVHITRERQRKKQEQEADAEEERQRKERERQQKQDVMTLGETREQIQALENELTQLKNEKHQLFGQLKKVLHEDDTRRRLIKETNVLSDPVQPAGGYMGDPNTVVHAHLYLPLPTRNPLFKVSAATPPHNLLQSGPLKRSHSPSPPPPPPVSTYHPGYGYKPPQSMTSYIQTPPKSEDVSRRSGDARVVLWNKNNQFPGSSYYAPSPGQHEFVQASSQSIPRGPEPGKPVYLTATRPSLPTMQTGPYADDKFYVRSGSHVTVHGGSIPIQQPIQGAKTGGITSGYPVRAPPQSAPDPYPPPPPATYVSGTNANVPGRMLYTQPGRYLQREM